MLRMRYLELTISFVSVSASRLCSNTLLDAFSNIKGLLTEGFFWIPSLAGPTTVAARQNGSGISWLFPFIVSINLGPRS